MAFTLEIAPAAKRDFKKLPPDVQKKVAFDYLPLIQIDPYKMGQPLAGVFKGERSFHFGRRPEYRIIYFIQNNLVVITALGSREEIYKKAKRRK
jgi:mRNA-degrading endonuclease RelE of RelBE toxin-antitoxin system